MVTLKQLQENRDPKNFELFNAWVMEFFKREYLRENGRIEEYTHQERFGPAMRQEVSFWNPNRSKHAEVYWLENFVFGQNTSMRNKILNAMAVKFVGMPTLTLVASKSADYAKIINFDEYKKHGDYYNTVNKNLDENEYKLKVWGATQLQTSLQTAARNWCREQDKDPEQPFKLSNMIRWMEHLDDLGMSEVVMNKNNTLRDVCEWLRSHRGIGPYFAYHPPCNFSRSVELSHIDEDQDYCLVGPGAKRGMEFVFPNVKFSNEQIMEDYIVAIKHHQFEFFQFENEQQLNYYKGNLENGGKLTTFGTEITFCQFNCYQAIKDNDKAQTKRMLPLTFDAFKKISEDLYNKINAPSLNDFICE